MQYMPQSPALLAVWASNLKKQLPAYSAVLGIPADKLATINTTLDTMISEQGNIAALQVQVHQLIIQRDEFISTQSPILRDFVKWIKTQSAYTPAIGDALKIISTTPVQDVTGYQPVLQYKIEGNKVHLEFKKHGADGMNFYWRLFGAPAFALLGNAKSSPYIPTFSGLTTGTTVQIEVYCMPTLKNDEVGVKSDIISIRYTP